VVDRRVERARRLVQQSDLPLKAIAVETGFSDQAHMTRTMRARLGATPGKLRSRR
jgi:AraC family transcriptional regulator